MPDADHQQRSVAQRRQQIRIGREQQRRAVENDPVEQRRQAVEQMLHFAQVQQFQRIDHRFARGHEVEIGSRHLRDGLVQRHAAQQIIGDAGAAVDAEQRVNDRPAEIEVREQRGVARQMRLHQRQIRGRKRLAFGGRRTGHHHGVNRLQRLHVIEARAQRAELLHGRFMRPGHIDQQRIGGGAERNLLHLLQQVGQIRPVILSRRAAAARASPFGRGTGGDNKPCLFGASQCIMYSAHNISSGTSLKLLSRSNTPPTRT